jgi:hypothetical protein
MNGIKSVVRNVYTSRMKRSGESTKKHEVVDEELYQAIRRAKRRLTGWPIACLV